MTYDMKEEGEVEEDELAAAGRPTTAWVASLRRVVAHVDSLVSSSYSAKLFPGKWKSIRNKLAQLSSGLIAAAKGAGCSDVGGESALSELLRAITATVEETNGLVVGCAGEPFAGGKLLMRSNLDLAASRLELHVRSLARIYASGVLTHGRAIVVPKPGAGASRDDMRFYVKDLFSRMKVGEPEVRARALQAFNEVLHEDEKYVRVAFGESPEVVALLVGFLDAGDVGIREAAADAVSAVAGFDSHRPSLVLARVVEPLVRLLETGSGLGKERAAAALKKLTENSDNAWSVSAQGGVTALLGICRDGSGGGELIGSASGVLRNLAGVGEIRRYMVEQGAVPVFVKLSRSKEDVVQILAMEFLQVLACGDADAKARVAREGGVESLIRVLDPDSSCSSKARETALMAIEALWFSPASSVKALIGAGFLDRLLFFLRRGDVALQDSALKVAARLSVVSDEARRAMGDAGFTPELVRLLEAKSPEVRETAAAALAHMASEQRARKALAQDEHSVSRILQLLGPGAERAAATKFLLSALAAISDSSSGRRKIATCHYVEHLQKLAESDVSDAKKIIKKLSGNRFMNMLSGIWSSS